MGSTWALWMGTLSTKDWKNRLTWSSSLFCLQPKIPPQREAKTRESHERGSVWTNRGIPKFRSGKFPSRKQNNNGKATNVKDTGRRFSKSRCKILFWYLDSSRSFGKNTIAPLQERFPHKLLAACLWPTAHKSSQKNNKTIVKLPAPQTTTKGSNQSEGRPGVLQLPDFKQMRGGRELFYTLEGLLSLFGRSEAFNNSWVIIVIIPNESTEALWFN